MPEVVLPCMSLNIIAEVLSETTCEYLHRHSLFCSVNRCILCLGLSDASLKCDSPCRIVQRVVRELAGLN